MVFFTDSTHCHDSWTGSLLPLEIEKKMSRHLRLFHNSHGRTLQFVQALEIEKKATL